MYVMVDFECYNEHVWQYCYCWEILVELRKFKKLIKYVNNNGASIDTSSVSNSKL